MSGSESRKHESTPPRRAPPNLLGYLDDLFILQTGKSEFSEENSYIVYADFSDASGIRWKTRVQVNGLDIGRISDIGHHRREDGSLTARVTLRIGDQYTIYKDARVKKLRNRSWGITALISF